MSWPLSQDYNEAIQSPESTFSDPELKTGQVVCNALGIPMPCSGNFADVYEVRCPNGSRWAVKCFTRQVKGLRERYQEISRTLQAAKFPFTVEFTYQQEGMRIRGRWFPILKMQWVEGLTFNEFVRLNLDKPATLDALLLVWARLAQWLRSAGIAHGDLQHGNVLLVSNSATNTLLVKLIDYDGMYVPALAGKPSGEVGHPAYQHPLRLRQRSYGAQVDRFPLLLIATVLRCLRVGGRALWERYDNGDNLLFRETDLKDPNHSLLFRELFGLSEVRALVGVLRRSLAAPLDHVPLLEQALPELAPPAAIPVPQPAQPTMTAAKVARVAGAVLPPPVARTRAGQTKHHPASKVGQARRTSTAPTKTAFSTAIIRQLKGSSLWVKGAIAVGLLALVLGLVYALGGRFALTP
jgi:hypothetical protein